MSLTVGIRELSVEKVDEDTWSVLIAATDSGNLKALPNDITAVHYKRLKIVVCTLRDLLLRQRWPDCSGFLRS